MKRRGGQSLPHEDGRQSVRLAIPQGGVAPPSGQQIAEVTRGEQAGPGVLDLPANDDLSRRRDYRHDQLLHLSWRDRRVRAPFAEDPSRGLCPGNTTASPEHSPVKVGRRVQLWRGSKNPLFFPQLAGPWQIVMAHTLSGSPARSGAE